MHAIRSLWSDDLSNEGPKVPPDPVASTAVKVAGVGDDWRIPFKTDYSSFPPQGAFAPILPCPSDTRSPSIGISAQIAIKPVKSPQVGPEYGSAAKQTLDMPQPEMLSRNDRTFPRYRNHEEV